MYEVSKHFYQKFLPEVINAAKTRGKKIRQKYEQKIEKLLAQEEHIWKKGLTEKEAEELRKMYRERYGEGPLESD